MVLLLCNILPPSLNHDTLGLGSPLESQRNVTVSPSSTSRVAFDRLVIVGGSEKLFEIDVS